MRTEQYSDAFRQRFWSRVAIAAANECWFWKGTPNYKGYGSFASTTAHKMAFLLSGGTVPEGHVVRHRCDVRLCCNPAHLEPGTQKDNHNDMVSRGRDRFRGSQNTEAAFTTEQVLAIRARHGRGASLQELAVRYRVCKRTIRRVVQGETYKMPTPTEATP